MPTAVWAMRCATMMLCATLGGTARAHVARSEGDAAETLIVALDAQAPAPDAVPTDPQPDDPPPKARPPRKQPARVVTKRTGNKVAQSPATAAPAAADAAPAPTSPATPPKPPTPAPAPPAAATPAGPAPAPQAGAAAPPPAAPAPQAPAGTIGDLQPVLHAQGAKITTCMDTIVGLSATVIDSAHTAISTWTGAAPNDHLFQSTIGLSYANSAAPNAAAVILAAPVGAGKCEGESVQIYPFGQSCTVMQAALIKQGRTVAMLRALPVVQTNNGFEDILLPTAGGGCVVVSVGLRKQ